MTSSPTAWPNNGNEQLACRAHQLQHERAAPGRHEHTTLVAQHLHRAGQARVGIRVRRHGAREREHGRARDDGARDADDKRDGIACEPRERAAGHWTDQRAAALQARHRGDRAAELVRARRRPRGTTVGRHPGRVAVPSATAAKPTSHGSVVTVNSNKPVEN